MRRVLGFLAAFLSVAFAARAQRLPELATPEHYQITVAPDLDKETFTGEETIDIRVLQPTSSIVLNAAEIKFTEATIRSGGQTQTAKVTLDDAKETATLALEKPLPAGPATIHIRYAGILNGQLRGFYISKASDRKYALTQLENTDARRMYPSFDEPAYKAAFDLTAIIDKSDTAISNGKVISDTPGPGEGQHTLKFATTPKMSSYLLALAVGDWECLEGSAGDIPIRICGVPGKKAYAGLALAAAEYTMKYYNRYFGIKYPYGKLDILGVADFSAGAMENTGCIIARDAIFLDPKESSYFLRKGVLQGYIAHEMAHQWFGDLVTMQWWDDVWLNEGFATWMSFKPMDAWKPEWNLPTDEASSAAGAMGTDGLYSTRAILAHAETPGEIQELFDSIAYNKAAAVLLMVEGYVGEETFRKGVNSYLAKYSYKNATSADFWNEIAQVSGKPVDRIMASFVKQPGVPLVTLKTACVGGHTKVALSQQRYFNDRAMLEAGSQELWSIPVCLKAGKSEKCALLEAKEQQMEMNGCGEPVYANAGARGYYRSGYSAAELKKIAASAEQSLSPAERYLLVEDTSAQVAVDHLPAGEFLSLAEQMKDDPSTSVIGDIQGQLQFVHDYLLTDADRPQFEAWVRSTFGPVAEKTGWTARAGDSDEALGRRGSFISILGLYGKDPKVIQMSREMTDRALKGEPVDRTLLFAAVPVAARNGDAALYNAIMGHFPQIKTTEEFYLYGAALCLFSDPALLTGTLNYAISPAMRSQDAPQAIGAVFGNPDGRQVAWDFVRQHWAEVEAKLSNYSTSGIVGSAGVFCDDAKRDEVQKFFGEHKVPASDRTLKLTLESISTCSDIRTRQQPQLQSWLQQQPAAASSAGGAKR